jgi:hypothetical protein
MQSVKIMLSVSTSCPLALFYMFTILTQQKTVLSQCVDGIDLSSVYGCFTFIILKPSKDCFSSD